MSGRKVTVPRKAYATWHPDYGINNFWVRASAKAIREENGAYWEKVKKRGWKIVRVKVSLDNA